MSLDQSLTVTAFGVAVTTTAQALADAFTRQLLDDITARTRGLEAVGAFGLTALQHATLIYVAPLAVMEPVPEPPHTPRLARLSPIELY